MAARPANRWNKYIVLIKIAVMNIAMYACQRCGGLNLIQGV